MSRGLIIDEVNTVVDSGQLTNSDKNTTFNESSFTFVFDTPVQRVTKISIDSAVIENGIYNINNDELRINISAYRQSTGQGDNSSSVEDVALINAGYKTHGDAFASEVASNVSAVSGVGTMTGGYDELQEKRYHFILADYTIWDYFVWNYSQPLRLMGFIDAVVFYQSVISTDVINISSLIIDETNDSLVFISEDNLPYTPSKTKTITLTHAEHTIYTIIYEINKGLESTGLAITDNTVKTVEYLSFSDKVIIRTNLKDPKTEWTVQNTPLAVTLKIDNQTTKYTAISDEPVDDSSGFDILDYSTIQVNNRVGGGTDTITIPVGVYTDINDIVTELNLYLTNNPPTFLYTFSYNSLIKKITINRTVIGSNNLLFVHNGGLARLLGMFVDKNGGSNDIGNVYTFPYVPKLHTKQIMILSDTLTRSRNVNSVNAGSETGVIYNIPYTLDNILYTNENNVKTIVMSVPRTISSIDFQILNDEFKLVNNNGGNVLINMTLFVS